MSRRAAKMAVQTVKRAAIYIRVSSEKQAEKVSPEAQDQDCRTLAERQGYQVVALYRDTEKYRVGKRLVEPTGTRADRPGLRAMLADARTGNFDVILAWREDRLYRSYRPMLDVLDCLEETGVTVELAKEHFDHDLAPVKAWAARMELQAKHDRMIMGVAGRLEQGKTFNGTVPYGYTVKDDFYAINEAEVQWVKLIWRLYAEGVSVNEIRRRLIARDAKQRRDTRKRKPWAINYIRQILHHDFYHTGVFQVHWGDTTYDLPIPVIVDPETAARVKENQARYKAYPAGNLQVNALAAGLVYCKTCSVKMSVVNNRSYNRDRSKVYLYLAYQCTCVPKQDNVPGCAGKVKMGRIDDEVWRKLWELISVPGRLEAAIETRVAELQAQEFDAEGDCAKLQKRLDDLEFERQRVITGWRKGKISDDELDTQKAALWIEESEIRREIKEKSLLLGNRAERLLAAARAYREAVAEGAIDVTKGPETPEEEARLWQFKKTMIQGLVERVDVLPNKYTEVTFTFDFSKALADLGIDNSPACRESHTGWDRPYGLAGRVLLATLPDSPRWSPSCSRSSQYSPGRTSRH